MFNTKNITKTAILLTLSILAFLIENAFPPVFPFAPFLKLGVSNVFVLITLIILGKGYALFMVLAKNLLTSSFSGLFSLFYSVPSGLISLLVMIMAMQFLFPKCSIVSVSVLGSAVFNAMQLVMYALFSTNAAALYYIPVSLLLSVATGIVTGFAVYMLVKTLPIRVLKSE